MQPFLSIITPNYNKDKFIGETINSVLNQSYSNFELIIIDDGSTDNSIEKIEEIKDDRIKLIKRKHEPKNGGAVCRNIGINVAKGEFLFFLDSDDLLKTNCLKRRLEVIKKHPDNDFWVFTIGTFYTNIGDSKYVWTLPKKNHLELFLQHDLPWHTMSTFWKTTFIKNQKGFDETFPRLQDVELHTKALLQQSVKYYVSNIKAPDCYYRIDESRIVTDYKMFINNWVSGTVKYINKFYPILKTEKKDYKKYLKGTLFSIINQLNYLKSIKKIDNTFYQKQTSLLFSETPYKKGVYIKFYNSLYMIGFAKLKGFNYISKKLYIYL